VKCTECFSCSDVGHLFCCVEQQIDKLISILNKVKYDDDISLKKLNKVLTDLRHHYITLHLQQFVYFSSTSLLLYIYSHSTAAWSI